MLDEKLRKGDVPGAGVEREACVGCYNKTFPTFLHKVVEG